MVPGREGLEGVGGGGAGVGCEDSVVPAGPRGWERRAPIVLLGGMFEVLVVVKKCCDVWVLQGWDGLESEWCWKWKGYMLVGVELK